MTRHLTFANLAAGLALVVAVAGSGYSVAASQLPANSVGTKQLKKNAVKSPQLKDGAVTGADVDESTLGTVPSATSALTAASAATAGRATTAGRADTAGTAATVTGLSATPTVRILFGQSATLARFGTLTVTFVCSSSEVDSGRLNLTTSVSGAAAYADNDDRDDSLEVGEQVVVGYSESPFTTVLFSARTAAGEPWFGQGSVDVDGTGCSTQLVLFG